MGESLGVLRARAWVLGEVKQTLEEALKNTAGQGLSSEPPQFLLHEVRLYRALLDQAEGLLREVAAESPKEGLRVQNANPGLRLFKKLVFLQCVLLLGLIVLNEWLAKKSSVITRGMDAMDSVFVDFLARLGIRINKRERVQQRAQDQTKAKDHADGRNGGSFWAPDIEEFASPK